MKQTSLTSIAASTHRATFSVGILSGLLGIIVNEWLDATPRGFLGIVIWSIVAVTYIAWETRFIGNRNGVMRDYATDRGAFAHGRGIAYEIVPFTAIFAFFIGIGALVITVGIYFLVVTQCANWAVGTVFVAAMSLTLSFFSAVQHNLFVRRIEDALNSTANGWETFHRWSPKTFQKLL